MALTNPPTVIPVAHLQRGCSLINADRMHLHEALYHGGSKFDAIKDKVLRKRQIELANNAGGNAFRTARLAAAHYTDHVGEIIDFFASAVMQAKPMLLAQGGSEETQAYYHSLNPNADGSFGTLDDLMRSRLYQLLIHKLTFISINFPELDDDVTDLAEQRERGALDATLCPIDLASVADCEMDPHGNLVWLLTHNIDLPRENIYTAPEVVLHTWTYITDAFIAEYQAETKIDKPFPASAVAKLTKFTPHDLGILPVISLKMPVHFMERLASPAIALFNREAAMEWALDSSAYSLMVIKTQRDIGTVLATEFAGLKLDPSDDCKFASPDAQQFAALSADCVKLKGDLYSAVQAMSLVAAGRPQAPRESAKAKLVDFESLSVLISMVASVLKEGLQKTIDIVKNAREDEDVEITIQGLDDTEILSSESRIALAQQFLALPGIPETARRWVLMSASLAAASDAPAKVREDIIEEALNPKEETLSPKEEPAPDDTEITGSDPNLPPWGHYLEDHMPVHITRII